MNNTPIDDSVIAWHFLKDVDGNPVTRTGRVMTVGDEETVDGNIIPCEHGLHGSLRALDALYYALGPWVQRADFSGTVVHEADKLASSQRRCLALANADLALRQFACWCAERALLSERAAGREPDVRIWQAIKTKRAWLSGQATDEELRVSEAAARTAAWCAADSAARAACWSSSWEVAWVVAKYAADAATSAAARAAEHKTQNDKLEAMLTELLAADKPEKGGAK